MKNDCPHEDGITYGKTVGDDKLGQFEVIQMLCESCGAVGTMIEEFNPADPDHYNQVAEAWHEPRDYFRSDLAALKTIQLSEVTA